jgi:hypothetical protein
MQVDSYQDAEGDDDVDALALHDKFYDQFFLDDYSVLGGTFKDLAIRTANKAAMWHIDLRVSQGQGSDPEGYRIGDVVCLHRFLVTLNCWYQHFSFASIFGAEYTYQGQNYFWFLFRDASPTFTAGGAYEYDPELIFNLYSGTTYYGSDIGYPSRNHLHLNRFAIVASKMVYCSVTTDRFPYTDPVTSSLMLYNDVNDIQAYCRFDVTVDETIRYRPNGASDIYYGVGFVMCGHDVDFTSPDLFLNMKCNYAFKTYYLDK